MTKQITVQYFAILREQCGCDREDVATSAVTVADLYTELQQRHQLKFTPNSLKVAVNDAFTDWTQPIVEGDLIVFIPPVAGG